MKKFFKNIFNSSFFKGVSSLTLFPLNSDSKIKKILDKADAESISEDWKKIGNDLMKAMKNNSVPLSGNELEILHKTYNRLLKSNQTKFSNE